ncbi:MAG: Potassium-transporting ATPase A chain [uncultured Acetobacteraceae bacterium]|uniref:Potassium-transporting ATPase A chain n=1 Tax=uncultured Acetobacteraceae bacterium TaxID=169975 RepID=A0A6J4J687_9PROT|nr:MAG: Potassium-transporting ATPase A chain [uncultured Acetobacteraceae bacterium]
MISRASAAGGVRGPSGFWADLTRVVLYLLLPLALAMGLALAALGVPQTLADYAEAAMLEGGTRTSVLGPAAFQVAIKQLGTNGGGFFGVNSTHPFENPNAWTNLIQAWAVVAIPFGLALTFGHIVRDRSQGRALLAVMSGFVLAGTLAVYAAEAGGNPLHTAAGAMGDTDRKEVRSGAAMSALWAAVTTGASNGSVNAMHDSFTAPGGLVPMFLIQLGGVPSGGLGSGLYGMLIFVLLAVFVAGLMAGRTPEYLGKRVQAKLATRTVPILPIVILGLTAVALVLPAAVTSIQDAGPHGLSEVLYAYTSGAGNNGSAFSGLTVDTP